MNLGVYPDHSDTPRGNILSLQAEQVTLFVSELRVVLEAIRLKMAIAEDVDGASYPFRTSVSW